MNMVFNDSALSKADKTKLGKLLNLTASNQDAEALSAIRKANALLKRLGLSWPDLLQAEEEVARPKIHAPEHVEISAALLKQGKALGIITNYERNFLTGIMGFKKLSPSQQEQFERIRVKYEAYAEYV